MTYEPTYTLPAQVVRVRTTQRARKRLRKRIREIWTMWDKNFNSLAEQKKRHDAKWLANRRYITQFHKPENYKAKGRVIGAVGMARKVETGRTL